MRIYRNFTEARNELKRELQEMGIVVHTKSVQNLNIENRPEFETRELRNYTYTILEPNLDEIELKIPQWAIEEWAERITSQFPDGAEFGLNPGTAWKLREKTWGPLRTKEGKFDYTYSNRYSTALQGVINALKADIYTRRAFLSVFDPVADDPANFQTRIPCTLGYWFNYRDDKLNMTYLLRSSDFGEHFNYDIWLSLKLMYYVAAQIGADPGTFTHWIGSFHVFSKEVADAF